MKLKLDVPNELFPEGKCPIQYSKTFPVRQYDFCAFSGIWCFGDLNDRPDNCPIVEVEE